MNHQNPTHIVLIGGGPAGLAFAQAAAQELPCQRKHQIKITLIEKNELFFNTYGSLGALVDASYLPKLFIPYDNALPKDGAAKIEHAIVNHVDYSANTITFTPLPSKESSYTINDDDQSIRYDYLIIATGSSYPTPIKPAIAVETREEVTQSIIEMADKSRQLRVFLLLVVVQLGVRWQVNSRHITPRRMSCSLTAILSWYQLNKFQIFAHLSRRHWRKLE